jgi:hypothetical protein
MGGQLSVIGAVFAMGLIGVMVAAPWSTRAIGQPAAPNAAKGEHKPAQPALLATPEPAAPEPRTAGAHRAANEDNTDAVTPAELLARVSEDGPVLMYPGKPIKFTAAS